MVEQHRQTYNDTTIITASELELRRQFRYYTRLMCTLSSSHYYHKKRIYTAVNFKQSEPLQGALADYFFACWYDMAFDGQQILDEVASKLPTHILGGFLEYINTGRHLAAISTLATRWSVLVSPSMNVPTHKLYVGKDDAKLIAKQVSEILLDARARGDDVLMNETQASYLRHCLACKDRMGFMMTWIRLAKEGWIFDDAWLTYKSKLESTLDD